MQGLRVASNLQEINHCYQPRSVLFMATTFTDSGVKKKTVSVRYTPKKQNQQSNNFQCNDFSSSLTLMILIPESPLSEPFLKVKEGSANIYSLLILKTHSIPYNPILP